MAVKSNKKPRKPYTKSKPPISVRLKHLHIQLKEAQEYANELNQDLHYTKAGLERRSTENIQLLEQNENLIEAISVLARDIKLNKKDNLYSRPNESQSLNFTAKTDTQNWQPMQKIPNIKTKS